MTQEDKDLQLKDLCARLPYHPKGHVVNVWNGAKCDEWLTCATFPMFTVATNNCRLYLRPMSSMTDEETEIFNSDFGGIEDGYNSVEIKRIDWLNANHFDYRGLISKGLAIAVTKENNPYKKIKL